MSDDPSLKRFTPLQIKDLEELSPTEQQELRESIDYIMKEWWFFPTWFFITLFFFGLAGVFFLPGLLYQVPSGLVVVYSIMQFMYRSGMLYGFTRGFEDGHVIGVRKVLGIDEEAASQIHEAAVEMMVDENVIDAMEKAEARSVSKNERPGS
jgi:hypothetical protein